MSAVALITVLKKRRNDEREAALSAEEKDVGFMTLTEESRALVKALQEDDISEEELLRLVNTEPPGDNSRADLIIRRARKIFQYLDINSDGVVTSDELEEVKGRLYQVRQSRACPPALHVTSARGRYHARAQTHYLLLCFVLPLETPPFTLSTTARVHARRLLTHGQTPC
jgi:hypothetical protein